MIDARLWKIAVSAVVGFVVLIILVSAWALSAPGRVSTQTEHFTVAPGEGSRVIAAHLKSQHFIRSQIAFLAYVKIVGIQADLKAGTYEVSAGMSASKIARLLASGDSLSSDISVTIPEGMNVWEIDDLLQAQHLIVPGSLARTYQADEGMLFPETYRLPAEIASQSKQFANAKNIGDVLLAQFNRSAGDYTNEQIIVASILEKEAKTADDMALVAGIIAKRREINMPLQVDATVGYGWCLRRWLPMSSTANCDVTQAPIGTEIKVDGPYNTYTRTGLPVGPISNPGLQALQAAKHPKKSDYLYYLSTRDGSQIIYSKTLDEHLKNRREYLGF